MILLLLGHGVLGAGAAQTAADPTEDIAIGEDPDHRAGCVHDRNVAHVGALHLSGHGGKKRLLTDGDGIRGHQLRDGDIGPHVIPPRQAGGRAVKVK